MNLPPKSGMVVLLRPGSWRHSPVPPELSPHLDANKIFDARFEFYSLPAFQRTIARLCTSNKCSMSQYVLSWCRWTSHIAGDVTSPRLSGDSNAKNFILRLDLGCTHHQLSNAPLLVSVRATELSMSQNTLLWCIRTSHIARWRHSPSDFRVIHMQKKNLLRKLTTSECCSFSYL